VSLWLISFFLRLFTVSSCVDRERLRRSLRFNFSRPTADRTPDLTSLGNWATQQPEKQA